MVIEGTQGDATLRSMMNWDAIKKDSATQSVLSHWQKLGQFRANHPAVGAGRHTMISEIPYIFTRRFAKDDFTDTVVIGLDLPIGEKTLVVSSMFNDGDELHDAYSGSSTKVTNGTVILNSAFDVVLLEKK